MKTFDYYEGCHLLFPNRKDYTTVYYYRGGVCIATNRDGRSSDGFGVKEVSFDEVGYKEATNEYHRIKNNLRVEFLEDMYLDYGVEGNPKRGILYDQLLLVLDDYGTPLSTVYEKYGLLVELIK